MHSFEIRHGFLIVNGLQYIKTNQIVKFEIKKSGYGNGPGEPATRFRFDVYLHTTIGFIKTTESLGQEDVDSLDKAQEIVRDMMLLLWKANS